ncbi:Amidohydrolase family protein [Mycobacterium marinum]|uniref:metal-dependent hydrolase family protein n=1 Tax=Mycobacterium marinum TaxID=1781 RepID=UPI0003589B20|nr:amidohydrolase family protein [Mycobacterium marinum]AXN43757.1 Amidohydrolase family protein [Mycobacterium marinum]AXN49123.1 Amidohydrolase family protein [Mycobacterium marinum]EPQ79416.1 Xaa-Pro dipeptidase [Mycobacterium marinum str. Europe]RFZ14233.1 Amidohydrolase family protein [Mycobacterium marinum]RFZ14293.1 Amidohydrolase family protein [Mycobacterium marinum]
MRLHVRGRGLPDETAVELWIVDGHISTEPVSGADTVFDGGWILPGLVDAHCHVGLGHHGAIELDQAIAQAEAERDAGALLLRDCGAPTDTRPLDDREDLPRIIRAGRHLARPKRYIPGFAAELEDESELPAAVAAQARRGDGWIKLVGDWIDRQIGDLAPLWSDEVLKAAIDAAHANGARVTAHVFGEDALPGLINAGIDCIEHGTGLTDDTISLMRDHGTALVPTLINVENFPGIADSAVRYPTYAAHMRYLYASTYPRVAAAREAGIAIYAGTDAGGTIQHGRIADEVEALKKIGMSATEALGAACWEARRWLGRPTVEHGASADLVCFSEDPRRGAAILNRPDLVILRGRTYRPNQLGHR